MVDLIYRCVRLYLMKCKYGRNSSFKSNLQKHSNHVFAVRAAGLRRYEIGDSRKDRPVSPPSGRRRPTATCCLHSGVLAQHRPQLPHPAAESRGDSDRQRARLLLGTSGYPFRLRFSVAAVCGRTSRGVGPHSPLLCSAKASWAFLCMHTEAESRSRTKQSNYECIIFQTQRRFPVGSAADRRPPRSRSNHPELSRQRPSPVHRGDPARGVQFHQ